MKPEIRVLLGSPRTGTHFYWSRYICSGRYQMAYDADILPALYVLSQKYSSVVQSFPRTIDNPYYNFRFNTLSEINKSLSIPDYLVFLSSKYNAEVGFPLFEKMLSMQDCQDKTLLIINRFVYTCSYNNLMNGFVWTIDDALEALKTFHEWSERSGFNFKWFFIYRNFPDWIRSLKRIGVKQDLLIQRIKDYKKVVSFIISHNIPIYNMEDVIKCFQDGETEFEKKISASNAFLDNYSIDFINNDIAKQTTFNKILVQLNRTISYLGEQDDYNRLSLARSIGYFKYMLYLNPSWNERYKRDIAGIILNNSKIKVDTPTDLGFKIKQGSKP